MRYFIVGCFLVVACNGENLLADIADTTRTKRENHAGLGKQQQELSVEPISYRPYNEAPAGIKKLVQLQRTPEPLVHLQVPREQLRLPSASAPNAHRAIAPERPTYKQIPLVQPNQYSPKVQYGEEPEQPNYKGIQAVQAGLRGQSSAPTGTYIPQYKTNYNAQRQQLDSASVYKAVHEQQQRANLNGGYKPQQFNNEINLESRNAPVAKAGLGQFQLQSQGQYPKNLPAHLKKIIDSQRAYQG